MYFNNVSDYLM